MSTIGTGYVFGVYSPTTGPYYQQFGLASSSSINVITSANNKYPAAISGPKNMNTTLKYNGGTKTITYDTSKYNSGVSIIALHTDGTFFWNANVCAYSSLVNGNIYNQCNFAIVPSIDTNYQTLLNYKGYGIGHYNTYGTSYNKKNPPANYPPNIGTSSFDYISFRSAQTQPPNAGYFYPDLGASCSPNYSGPISDSNGNIYVIYYFKNANANSSLIEYEGAITSFIDFYNSDGTKYSGGWSDNYNNGNINALNYLVKYDPSGKILYIYNIEQYSMIIDSDDNIYLENFCCYDEGYQNGSNPQANGPNYIAPYPYMIYDSIYPTSVGLPSTQIVNNPGTKDPLALVQFDFTVVSKFDPDFKFIYNVTFTSNYDINNIESYEFLTNMLSDSNNNLYVSTSYNISETITDSDGTKTTFGNNNLNDNGSYGIVVCFDSGGQFKWYVQTVGQKEDTSTFISLISVDLESNLLVNVVGDNSFKLIDSTGTSTGFFSNSILVKIDSTGKIISTTSPPSTMKTISLVKDKNDDFIYNFGGFSSTTTSVSNNNTNTNINIAKYNSDLTNQIWSNTISGDTTKTISSLNVKNPTPTILNLITDNDNNILTSYCSYFNIKDSTGNVISTNNNSITTINNIGNNGYGTNPAICGCYSALAKYDTDGNLIWINDLSVDYDQDIMISGICKIPVAVSICFPKGTLITTDQGQIPIEKINPETKTINQKKIVGIVESENQEKRLVQIKKDALYPGYPNKTTLMTSMHAILYNGEMVRAKDLISLFGENVKYVRSEEPFLYTVLMEKHERMKVNNMIVETLDPEHSSATHFRETKTNNY